MSLYQKDDGKEFIKLYYQITVSKPLELPKFYDEFSMISRPSFPLPKQLGECANNLAIISHKDYGINITSTTILPNTENILIMVSGSIEYKSNTEKLFTQTFLLEEKSEKLYITSDAFQYVEKYDSTNNYIEKFDELKGEALSS